jgi:pantoate--beta-alanine ligase
MRAKTMTVHPSVQAWREARRGPDFTDCSIGFVPTMGALHAGHRAILEQAWAKNDRVVLSIFVNPTQFNDPADLQKYPRTLEADLALAAEFTTDVIVPTPQELYPDDYRYRVTEQELSREMEGAQRPGHFDGVLTVVLKLLNLVQAHRVYLGEKDWQQLQLIRGMTKALYLPTEVIACPTIRGADGLALSSRNARLSADGRVQAVHFPKILRAAPDAATAALKLRFAGFDVDYVEDRDGVRLGAVRIENVRLIDNARL